MPQVAKIFTSGGNQAVRLPAEFRFQAAQVYIRRDPVSGDVVLSSKAPGGWEEFVALRGQIGSAETADFLVNRNQPAA